MILISLWYVSIIVVRRLSKASMPQMYVGILAVAYSCCVLLESYWHSLLKKVDAMISKKQQSSTPVVGRWDLIPSEVLDLLFEAGIPRDVSCDLIESLPDDLWPQIQLVTVHLNSCEAKICNCITVVLAYLMQHDFKLTEDVDAQMSSAFHFLQGKMAERRIHGNSDDIELVRARLDKVVIHFLDQVYQADYVKNIYHAANEPVH